MKKFAKVTVTTIIIFIIGFGLGYACANIPFGRDNSKGDITKVSRFSKNTVSPQASAYQEKIMNDPEAMEQAKASLSLLSTRMEDFDNLVGFAMKSCQGNEYLASSLEEMKSLSSLSANAKNAALAASESFDDMVNGKKGAANDFETASHNLILAYLMVDRQAETGKDFVQAVDEYMKGRKVLDNFDLATTRDLWASYLATQAYINDDNKEMKYWTDRKALLTESDVLAALRNNLQVVFIFDTEDTKSIINCNQHLNAWEQFFTNKEEQYGPVFTCQIRNLVNPEQMEAFAIRHNIDEELGWLRVFNQEKLNVWQSMINNVDVSDIVWRH